MLSIEPEPEPEHEPEPESGESLGGADVATLDG